MIFVLCLNFRYHNYNIIVKDITFYVLGPKAVKKQLEFCVNYIPPSKFNSLNLPIPPLVDLYGSVSDFFTA